MFCTNCGANIPDGSQFCPACGAQLNSAAYAPMDTPGAPVQKRSLPKKTLVILAAAVVVLVVVVLLISLLFGGGKETPLKNYCEAMGDADVGAFLDLYPDDVLNDVYGWNKRDKDEIENFLEVSLEELEWQYGEDIRISYDIRTEKELNDKRLLALGEYFEDVYDLDKADKEITKGYLMEVRFTIKGDDGRDTNKQWLVVYKYDGDWYLDTGAFRNVGEISTLID